MPGKVGLYYARVPNMGDLLNVLICERYFGIDVKRRSPLTCQVSGIGSGLDHFTLAQSPVLRAVERMAGVLFPRTYIWGTGFIREREEDAPFYRKDMHFCAVRGKLTKERVERILGKKLQIPTGDGGILASELLEAKVEKRYRVGIVPHFKEQSHPAFLLLKEHYSSVTVIDLREDPMEVIRQIAACEHIISSSLHGLIVADSLGIPNVHIKVSDALLGDGFKFRDYYSGYGLEHEPILMRPGMKVSLGEVLDRYRITAQMVEEKKQAMAKAFPFRGEET